MRLKPFAVCAVALLSATYPVEAASDIWTVGMEGREGGGEILTTSVDGVAAEGTEYPPLLSLWCLGQVNLRYYLGDMDDLPPGPYPDEEHDFTLRSNKAEVTLHMQHADFDGAFEADFSKTHPAMELLWAGDSVEIFTADDKYPPRSFTLNGSAAAIATFLAGCP